MNIPPEVIDAIKSSFENAKYPKTVKTRPCRIKFNGEFITTRSKKTVWRNKGFAKSALLHHFNGKIITESIYKYLLNASNRHPYFYVPSDEIKKLRDELENLGIIEYVEVDMENFAVQKK
jgi:hypothetical protein